MVTSYPRIAVPPHAPDFVRQVAQQVFDTQLEEVHWMLANPRPSNVAVVPLDFSLSVTLLAVTDAVAKLLLARPAKSGAQFTSLIIERYPWDADPPPEGLSRAGVANIVYDVYRCPLIHAAGIRIQPHRKIKTKFALKSEAGLFALAGAHMPMRPLIVPAPDKTILNLDTLYWGVRRMIDALLADPIHCEAIERWITSGDFARTTYT